MTLSNDCYFYYYSNCTKGDGCSFRHEPLALGTEDMCEEWELGKCVKNNCSKRHMKITKDRSSTQCYWESQPTGCQKTHCPFKHSRQKPVIAAVSSTQLHLKELNEDVPSPKVPPILINVNDSDDEEGWNQEHDRQTKKQKTEISDHSKQENASSTALKSQSAIKREQILKKRIEQERRLLSVKQKDENGVKPATSQPGDVIIQKQNGITIIKPVQRTRQLYKKTDGNSAKTDENFSLVSQQEISQDERKSLDADVQPVKQSKDTQFEQIMQNGITIIKPVNRTRQLYKKTDSSSSNIDKIDGNLKQAAVEENPQHSKKSPGDQKPLVKQHQESGAPQFEQTVQNGITVIKPVNRTRQLYKKTENSPAKTGESLSTPAALEKKWIEEINLADDEKTLTKQQKDLQVKSFEQIMEEKRKRKLEQKADTTPIDRKKPAIEQSSEAAKSVIPQSISNASLSSPVVQPRKIKIKRKGEEESIKSSTISNQSPAMPNQYDTTEQISTSLTEAYGCNTVSANVHVTTVPKESTESTPAFVADDGTSQSRSCEIHDDEDLVLEDSASKDKPVIDIDDDDLFNQMEELLA